LVTKGNRNFRRSYPEVRKTIRVYCITHHHKKPKISLWVLSLMENHLAF
jgi:hypothetical protein